MQPKAWLMWGTVACIALAAFNSLIDDDILNGDKAIVFFAMALASTLAWTLLVLMIWGVRSIQARATRSYPPH